MESAARQGEKNWGLDQRQKQRVAMNLRMEEARAQYMEVNDEDDDENHPHKRHDSNTVNNEYFNEGLSFFQRGSDNDLYDTPDPTKPTRGRVTPDNIKLLQEKDAQNGKTAAAAREETERREEMESAARQGEKNWELDQRQKQRVAMNLRMEEARAQYMEVNDEDDDENHPHKRHDSNTVNNEYFNGGLN